MLAFQVRGWELVVAGVERGADRVARAARAAQRRGSATGRYTLELPLDPPPEQLLAELTAGGAHARLAQPDPRDARGLLRRAGHGADVLGATRLEALGSRRESHRARSRVNVFRESVRDKVLYNLVLFAILLIGASYLIGQLTAGQDVKIIKDLGLAATSIFGLFIAVFIGIGLVSKEVERRSIYACSPSRSTAISSCSASTAGLVLTLAVNVAVMAVALYAVLAYMAWGVPAEIARGVGRAGARSGAAEGDALIFVELMLVTALALFFSTFSTPILSAALTFGLFVVGHFSADLRTSSRSSIRRRRPRWRAACTGCCRTSRSSTSRREVVHGMPVPVGYMALTAAYGALYIAMLLAIASLIFSRRDFK